MFIDIFSEKPLEEVEAKVGGVSRLLTEEDREKAYELYIQGQKAPAIAKKLGVSENTVRKWIRTLSDAIRIEMEERTGSDLLSSIIDEYEMLKSFAYMQIKDMTTEVASDGTVLQKKPDHSSITRYLELVQRVLKDKADLFCKTGAIAKEPDRLQVNIRGENKSELTVKVEATERSIEEIQRDIEERLKHASTIG